VVPIKRYHHVIAVGSPAQNKKKTKSTKKLTKQYVDYVRNKDKGKKDLAQKGSSDPATVTRQQNGVEDTIRNNAFDEYNKFKQEAKDEYVDFRRQCNEKYAEFLKEAWKSYQAGPIIPKPKDETVPPVVMPKEDEDKPAPKPKPVPIDTVVPPVIKEEPKPQPKPVAPIYEQPQPVDNRLQFAFFGIDGRVRIPEQMPTALSAVNSDVSGDALSKAWKALSGGGYDNLIRDCLAMRIQYNLCDWAYLLMVRSLAERYCGGWNNAATFFSSWIYCQTGYQMKFGETGGKLYMMMGTNHTVYDLVGYRFDNYHYYVIVNKGETAPTSMNICDADFEEQQPMSLWIPKAQKFPENLSELRTIKSSRYPEAAITVQVNKNLIDFYNTYPTSMVGDNLCSRWAMYANTPMASNVVENTYPQLRKKIAGKSQLDAANIILNWIQTGMKYEYDDKVWGGDRAFFPEETLYYPYCDCEDRAILYTRLIHDLLGLKCLLVFYPGHLAAAVNFTDNVEGDWISIGNGKYIITDPTYIGAAVGRTMPGMDNKTAKVIVVE
jgi:hypothetical protein